MINAAHEDYTIKPTLTVHNFVHTHTHSFNVCDDRLVSFGRCRHSCLSVSIVLCVTSVIIAYRSTRRSLYRRLWQY